MKKLLRISFLFSCCTLLFADAVCGQEVQDTRLPIVLVLKLESDQVCYGDKLNVQATLLNKSKASRVVNAEGIFSLAYFKSIRTINGKVTSSNTTWISEDEPEPDYLSLKPGETLSQKWSYPLDTDFFSYEATYSISVAYREFVHTKSEKEGERIIVVESNVLDFTVKRCGP